MKGRPELLLQELSRRVLVWDGAMGTSLQAKKLKPEDFRGRDGCNEYLVITRPDAVEDVHRSFLSCGSDGVETDTFGGSRLKLDEYALGDHTLEINRGAAELARGVCAEFEAIDGRPRFVAGSMGPTGMLPSSSDPDLSDITCAELEEIFREQASALIQGGVDALIIETAQDILEVRCAVFGARRAMEETGQRAVLITQVTLDPTGRMLLGTDISGALGTLQALRPDVIGLNCSTGPREMVDAVRFLAEHAPCHVSIMPNAGIPENRHGEAVYPLQPQELGEYQKRFVEEFKVGIVGGCCGTTPAHLSWVVEAVRGRTAPPRPKQRLPFASSGKKSVSLMQEPRPLIVGERVNAQGSRKVKGLLLSDDYNGILQIARDQVEGGAHVLDVCCALTERADEKEQMVRLVKLLSQSVEAPLVIDSTEPEVMAAALEACPARPILNSVNLEKGREKVDRVLPLAAKYGAAVVAMCIDEQGMATTADRKAQVARRLYDICTKEFGLDPEAVLFDCLTFTLATGDAQYRHSAVDTLDGIRRIKAECPGALTILGVSNVSFGLAKEARPVVNSVFLYHAVQAGLDAAIVNPKDITPYPQIPPADRALCDDLIFDRRPDALQQIIARFAEGTEAAAAKGGKRSRAEELKVLPPEERIHRMILERHGEGVEEAIDGAMKSRAPVAVINEILLPAMKEVGDRFGAGELILPFVLQSAEVMKRAVAYVEKFLDKNDAVVRGKVVLATVYGDVHDIGKNLVKTILSNNGYKVWDLGKQVPIGTILEKAVEVGADAIGLSALLVSTSKQMPACVKELDQRGLKFPVLLGGAAINRKYGLRTLYVEGDRTFAGGVYYARDAFEGLDIMNALMGTGRAALEEKVRREAHLQRVMELGAGAPPTAISATEQVVRSEVKPVPRVPEPPFWGVRVAEASELDLRGIFECLDLRELFKLQWGVRAHGEKYERLLDEEFRPLLRELQDECIREGHFTPRVVYGYFPVRAEGNDLVVLDPQDRRTERVRFHYPRQPEPPRLCLSDYYADGKRLDVAAFQVVTVGDRATRLGEELDKDGHFSRALFIHGLAVETAEAMAEFWHRRVRREMGLADRQGKRYSPGYPAWPELEDQAKIWKLLEPDRNIGVTLTSAHQMVPEQSTSAIVVHHPDALYFSLRPGRESRAPSFDPMR